MLSKSETSPGVYRPASQLDDRRRREVRQTIRNRRAAGVPPAMPSRGDPSRRGLGHVYEGYAFGDDPARYIKAPTRPSSVHPNIQYGKSVGPAMERKLDRSLDPKLTAGLHHPVVFHHGEAHPGAIAGALGAHETSGGKGHVVINSTHVDHKGNLPLLQRMRAGGFAETVNHELAHASRSVKNPHLAGRADMMVRNAGEEARADAVAARHRGLYARSGMMPGRTKRAALRPLGKLPEPMGSQVREGLKVGERYHQVRRELRSGPYRHPWTPGDAGKEALHVMGKHPQAAAGALLIGGATVASHRRRIGKAFDPERSRQRRLSAYEGGAAGGSVVAGESARRLYRQARRTGAKSSAVRGESTATHVDVQRALHRMAQPTASPGSMSSSKSSISHVAHLHRKATDLNVESLRLANRARRVARAGKASGVAAAGLGAAAYGLHREQRHDKTYGYR